MEIGATLFASGSHKRLFSHPANAKEMAVPVLAKKGSVIFLIAIFGMKLERGLSPGSGLK
jgi:ectoine hydroxylase-related dioxygenase (phytanoyl-CoA dioxygenase family)